MITVTRRHVLAVVTVIAISASCEPSSGTDREVHREKILFRQEVRQFWHEWEQIERDAERDFRARFEGRIVPGVGCDVCSELCRVVDLRGVPRAMFRQLFRRAVHLAHDDLTRRNSLLAMYEFERLGCIAAGDGASGLGIIKELMNDDEPLIRYRAALMALQRDLMRQDASRVLHELARGDDDLAETVRIVLANEEL